MASTTLVVSLAGLTLKNVEKLVTARGIDKVLVVDTPSSFADTNALASAAGAARSIRQENREIELQVAFATGDQLEAEAVGEAELDAVRTLVTSAGGGFTVAPVENGLAAQLNAASVSGTVFTTLSSQAFSALTASEFSGIEQDLALTLVETLESTQIDSILETGSIALEGLEQTQTFKAPVFTASPLNNFLTDLDGSVQVNLDVEQFKEIAKNA